MGRTRRLPSAAELNEKLTRKVEDSIDQLSGVALVQAWKQVRQIAMEESAVPADASTPTDVLTIIRNTDLPKERQIALLTDEQERLLAEAAAVAAYIEELQTREEPLWKPVTPRSKPSGATAAANGTTPAPPPATSAERNDQSST